jgi:hypothetical protein
MDVTTYGSGGIAEHNFELQNASVYLDLQNEIIAQV